MILAAINTWINSEPIEDGDLSTTWILALCTGLKDSRSTARCGLLLHLLAWPWESWIPVRAAVSDPEQSDRQKTQTLRCTPYRAGVRPMISRACLKASHPANQLVQRLQSQFILRSSLNPFKTTSIAPLQPNNHAMTQAPRPQRSHHATPDFLKESEQQVSASRSINNRSDTAIRC